MIGPLRDRTSGDDSPTQFGEAPTMFGDTPTRLGAGDDAPTIGPSVAGSGASAGHGPLMPGQNFGTRYHIIRLLGIGGMGAVYQAWDGELGVVVAIKVVRPEVLADPYTATEVERRFKRELLLARQVTHKNVVRIHDIGEIGGIKYITMSYVDGTDLATILRQQGALPVLTVMRIARSVLSGLVAAHAADVVHRDLKPANIIIGADGDALIMDFGIARSTGGPTTALAIAAGVPPAALRHAAPRAIEATMQGAIVGTVPYMAPEQAKGEDVDQRADIYALGLMLYDMLAGGRRTERAENVVADLESRMEHAPSPVRSLVPTVPQALDALVSRCLEPDPARRFQTTKELEGQFDRLDDNGELIPLRRVVGLPLAVVVAILLMGLSGVTWWYTRQSIPPAPHDPVLMLISDFKNGTGDPSFDRALEPMLKRALEGAGFITAYDRSAVSTLGVQPPQTLDEGAAREIAAKQGVGVILSGSLERQGSGYAVSVKASQTLTGNVIANATRRAASKDAVLSAATTLADTVRSALGDDKSDSAQLLARASLSAGSLGVLSQYAAGREAAASGKFEEARQHYLKAIQLDPNFGIGYQALGALSINVGALQDADRYFKEALRHLDGMTERERFTTRGLYYRTLGDYPQCVKEYTDLISRYAADVLAHNNLALCSTFLRDLPRAVTEMRRLVDILPKRALYRLNLSLYASYAGDFATGEKEARAAQDLGSPMSGVPLAFAQLGQNQPAQTAETFQRLARETSLGRVAPSYAASGLGDLASYEGRFSESARLYSQGAADDLTDKNTDRAAAKFASMAYALLSRGQKAAAVAAADKALQNSKAVKIRFLAARIFVEADQAAKATPLIAGLAAETLAEPQAYAKIVQGDVFAKAADHAHAITALTDANKLLDTWIGHFDLGRAYLDAGEFLQADSEFDRCIKRKGEALALFLDEEPTYAYLPPVYYYQGRVREELKTREFAQSYRTYLSVRGTSNEDPMVADARRRAGTEP